jgi:ubiquinone biosynthesis monooxygenase Coq7
MIQRHYSLIDQVLINLDQGIRTVFGKPPVTERPDPAADLPEQDLNVAERHLSAALMRVNHAGEVSAQALYHGQALTARQSYVREKLEQASMEENDHLVWCERRVQELGSHTSRLNPLWYVGSFAIGALAGFAGDKWSLGFVAETEHQVVRHLDQHLARLPTQDNKSRAILAQMRQDEGQHATLALQSGGAILPEPIKKVMGLVSKVMTGTAFRF